MVSQSHFSQRSLLFYLRMLCAAGLVITLQAGFLEGVAYSNPQNATNSKSPAHNSGLKARKKYKLTIQPGEVIGVSLKANKAPLADITGELAKRLNTRIVLGPGMEKQLVTTEFVDLPLDMALQQLTPRVYVDYEIRSGAPPARVGILLFALDDSTPALNALVSGNSQAFLIEGNTEDISETQTANEGLQVELEGNNLTVKSKKQPLVAVVITVAHMLGVPAEIKYESAEILDVEIKKMLVEDAIPRLSPNLRLFVRADLWKSTRTPLRVSLVAPEKVDGQ